MIGNVLYDCCLTHALERYLTVNYPEVPLPAPHPMGGAKNAPPNFPVSSVRPLQHMNFPSSDFEPNMYSNSGSFSRFQPMKSLPTSSHYSHSIPPTLPTTYDHYVPANLPPDNRSFMSTYSAPNTYSPAPLHLPYAPNNNYSFSQPIQQTSIQNPSTYLNGPIQPIAARPLLSTQHLIHSFPSSQESKPPSQDSNDETNKSQSFSVW